MAVTTKISLDFVGDYSTAFGAGNIYNSPYSVSTGDGEWMTSAVAFDGGVRFAMFNADGTAGSSTTGSAFYAVTEARAFMLGDRRVSVTAHADGKIKLDLNTVIGTGSNVEMAAAGTQYAAVWQQNFTATDNDIWVAVGSSNGSNPTTFRVDSSRANDTDASVAVLSNGNVVVAWNRTDTDGETALWYGIYTSAGGIVSAPFRIDAAGSINRNPSVVANGNGFSITYQDNETGDLEIRSLIRGANGTNAFNTLSGLPGPDNNAASVKVGGLVATAFAHDYVQDGELRDREIYVSFVDPSTGITLVDRKHPLIIGNMASSPPSVTSLGNGKILVSYDADGVVHQQVSQVVETIKGDENANLISGKSSGVVHIDGGGGDDSLFDSDGSDRLLGGTGNDTLVVDEGDDYLEGGSGTDTVSLRSNFGTTEWVVSLASPEPQNTGFGIKTLVGIENLTGSLSADTLIGNDAANELNDGDDGYVFIATNTLIGGGGNDTYIVHSSRDIVVETSASGGVDLVKSGKDFKLSANVENLTLLEATAFTGGTKATGNSLANIITGNHGFVSNNVTTQPTLTGLAGSDTYIVKTAGTKVVESSASSGGINDIVKASVSYTLVSGVGVEQLMTTNAAGKSAIDLKGNAFKQTITGNAGANSLTDGGGAGDILKGLAGNDTYVILSGATTIGEATGTANGTADIARVAVSYTLAAGVAVEKLVTTDEIGSAKINLTGNAFTQTIIGNDGANRINGGAGADVLTGRGGADTFLFTDAPKAGIDRITDMTHDVDLIHLSKADFTALGTINQALGASAFFASTAGTAHDASDRIIYDTDSGKLFYDADGNKAGGVAAIQFAAVGINLKLDAGDFFVVS